MRKNQPVDKYKCRTALTKDTGAVAFRKDRSKAAKAGGIPADGRDEWRRATAQAILGLQFAPASKDKFRIESVRTQARAGERVQFRVYGLAPKRERLHARSRVTSAVSRARSRATRSCASCSSPRATSVASAW